MTLDQITAMNIDKIEPNEKVKERQFKGLSLSERKLVRREKLIEAGIQTYGTHGFFSVTVKDICKEAKLTERYFYESFKKSEHLFQCIFIKMIEKLQITVLEALANATTDPKQVIHSVLNSVFSLLKNEPRMARIIYIDAMLVQELHQQATIRETMAQFDLLIYNFIKGILPELSQNNSVISLIATGLNGYVTQIAVRWVMNDFKQPQSEIIEACELTFMTLLENFFKK